MVANTGPVASIQENVTVIHTNQHTPPPPTSQGLNPKNFLYLEKRRPRLASLTIADNQFNSNRINNLAVAGDLRGEEELYRRRGRVEELLGAFAGVEMGVISVDNEGETIGARDDE